MPCAGRSPLAVRRRGRLYRAPRAVAISGVLAGKTVTHIAQGDTHTCVLADGQPYCWGDNTDGQLGTGSTPGTISWAPVSVATAGAAPSSPTHPDSLHPTRREVHIESCQYGLVVALYGSPSVGSLGGFPSAPAARKLE
ncbi:RCC1-like domain-containing protein [Arthrobacter sp. UNC362MFTsu5.1]|uniref:RCC1-like domain-containing protein n=1 Tax=Arthrobacter sp. UNC362MFTsu5.1 TaxID=1449044 RepID=UPI0012DF80A8